MIRKSLIPLDLQDSALLNNLLILQSAFDESSDLVKSKSDIPVKQINQAVSEFIDLLMFTSTLETKSYILKRLTKLKSVEKVLEQIESYLPVDFDYTLDSEDGLPKTHYTPRLLKVAMESLTINNLSSDFITIIDAMFNQLLYFLDYKLTIKELIYNLTVEIEKELFKTDFISMKLIKIEDTYYQ